MKNLNNLPAKLQEVFQDTKAVLAFAVLNRLLLLAIGYVSLASSANKNFGGNLKFDPQFFLQLLDVSYYGDIISYVYIADHGYTVKPFSADEQVNWAFYPMWPLLMRLGSFLTGGETFFVGIVLANLIFLISIVYLYRLIRIDFSKEIAYLATVLAIIFPASYFYFRPGPESLFLLLSILSLFFAKKSHWLRAGFFAALASVTRLQGVLLLSPLLLIYYQQHRQNRAHNLRVLSLLLIPAFYFLFLSHMYSITGNPLASFAIQKKWDSSLSLPFKSTVEFILSPNLISYYGWDLSPVSFLFIVFSTVITVVIARNSKFPKEYVVYTVLHLLLIVSRNNIQASLRFILPVFPLYIAMALYTERRQTLYNSGFFGFVALQVAYFIAFVHRYHFAHT